MNEQPDIRILVGNEGDDVVSGKSAALIRKNLNKALSAGIKINVGSNNTNSKISGGNGPSITEQQQNTLVTEAATNAQRRHADATRSATLERIRQNKTIADGSLALARFNDYLMTIDPRGLAEFGVQIAKIRTMFASKNPLMIKSATAEVNRLKAALKSARYEGGNVFTYLGAKIKTFATYLISSALTMGVIKGIRDIITTVKELDGSLTDLRIVTGGTREETQELLSTYNKMAHELEPVLKPSK